MSAAATTPASPPPAQQPSHLWKDGKSFGFHDLLDLINPLQHLPIISSVYRWVTGDEPGDVARVAGDTLYGGPIGLVLGLVDTATEDAKGRDLGERTVAALFGSGSDSGSTPSAPKVAAAPTAAPTPAPAAASAAWLSAFPDVAKNGAAPTPAKVASLYASPPAAPAQKAAALPPPVLDHPPMPLRHRVGASSVPASAAPAAPASPTEQDPAARAFLARTARQPAASAGNPEGRQLSNHPVPLQLSGGLSFSLEQPRALKVAAPAAATSPVAVTPAQVPQKMMEALDKYRRLQQQLDQQNAAAAEAVPGGVGLTP